MLREELQRLQGAVGRLEKHEEGRVIEGVALPAIPVGL